MSWKRVSLFPVSFFTYSHGSNVGNYHFIWRAPEGVNVESSHTENMRLIEDIKRDTLYIIPGR